MDTMARACDVTLRRVTSRNFKPPVYWWSEDVAGLRTKCFHARRLFQRARVKKRPTAALQNLYLEAHRKLKKSIQASKKRCWKELCSEIDQDPWGRAYKVAMAKLKCCSVAVPSSSDVMKNIVKTLFPQHPEVRFTSEHQQSQELVETPPITIEELSRAQRRVGLKKAPGLDKIPNLALKTAIKTRPEIFIGVYNKCLEEGVFPARWKRQRLVLLLKAGKPPELPSSYRPLCMLDTAGKVLETILHYRLAQHTESNLSENQFGFRKGRSTIDAVELALTTARQAVSGTNGPRGTRRYCLMVTLDIKNAFNSARWDCIWHSLNNTFSVPLYLRRMVASYLSNRILWYDTKDGPQSYRISSGVPQGSVLGPLLWNIMYDGLMGLDLPTEVKLIAFADDVAVTIVDKELAEVEIIFHESMAIIQRWMVSVGLELAVHKTEAVLITGRKVRENITLQVGNHNITSQPSIRYLGLLIDQRLNFKDHLVATSKKAAATIISLSRLMPNIGGPRQSRRALLTSVSTPIRLYGAPVWSKSLRISVYRRKIAAVHRLGALRMTCAYRTVSEDAICVISGNLPIEILADERRRMYQRRGQTTLSTKTQKRSEERQTSLREWQMKWDLSLNGRWTYRLIPNIEVWVTRSHGELNFHLTQLFTGHGCFRYYLNRMRIVESPDCPCCRGAHEDAPHVIFACPRFQQQRSLLETKVEEPLTHPRG